MAVNSSFYVNAADLATATSVYLDLSLTNIAPDGFYGDGTITRQQSSGILLTSAPCVSPCPAPCGTAIGAGGNTGVYQTNLDVGSVGTGAIIISFNPQSVPDGIRATYNSVVYNKISSPVNGPFQCPNYGHYAIIGSIGNVSSCGSWYPAGITQTNTVFLYNPAGNNFVNTGTTQTDVIVGTSSAPTLQPDYFLTTFGMQNCIMVIPKPTATPSALLIEIIGPCTSTGWSFTAACPVALPTFPASNVFASASIPCATPLPNTFYFAKVHTALDSYVGLYDYVFTDVNGQFPLPTGYYLTSNVAAPNKVIEVDNGVIVAITNCTTPPLPVTGLVWATTVNNPCNATPWVISNQNLTIRYNVTDSTNCGGTCGVVQAGTATATITVGAVNTNMGLTFTGIGELQAPQFEIVTFQLDGVQIADAHAAGGNQGCAMGPVVQTYQTPPPYLLLAGTTHTLFINFTTADGLYHVGSFYQVNLTFS